ncbi:translation elongation factor 4 [candidate division WWE3 bacterium]|uniref:Elongation factor 4 n=1 Tax=candidate division WWE3 bacterium TaxID=2053526 RepID=A0A955EB64_UNCKA|nr:translation elongation factor 4 [candidate division WWE3 bacterium]
MPQHNIRNFCIIAHIDHGKSTLADRLLEITGTIDKRDLHSQELDSMELEREKGITIKLKAVKMLHEINGTLYQLNLIDTPGHVDFAYEVSRSLAACDGAILVVDATQGIEAQTVSNIYKALDADLKIIPVLNKIDLPSANVEKVSKDLEDTFGFKKSEILTVSAKTGDGVAQLLEQIVDRIESPKGDATAPTRALVFDTHYDEYLGVVALVNVVDGAFTPDLVLNRKELRLLATKSLSTPESFGVLNPKRQRTDNLKTGEVGYISTGLKDIHAVRVGDTIVIESQYQKVGNIKALPGYQESKPFVFVSIYPIENAKFPDLRDALEKLSLSDASLIYEPEASTALGFGFRCGFLGLLHADIIQERLEREYNLELISTTPTVEYQVDLTNGQKITVKSASDLPEVQRIAQIREPWLSLNIVTPKDYTGGIITLCEARRGIMKKMDYPSEDRVIFEYELPLAELVHNFFDELKTISSGYASLDYELLEYRPVNVVKMDILVHGDPVAPLAQIVLKDTAAESGRIILKKLKDVIPRQQFKVALQAAIGGKIIAREDIGSAGKHVLGGMSGGHRERKDKLLEKQQKGKARMKLIGKVAIPQEAFREVLKS